MLNRPEEIKALIMLIISYLGHEIEIGNLEPAVLATGLVDMTDFVDCIETLNKDNLIFIIKSDGKRRCGLSDKGRSILPELKGFIPEGLREEAISCAWKYYEAIVYGIEYYASMVKKDGGFYVTSGVRVNSITTCETTAFFDTEKEALRAKKNCDRRPQSVVNTVLAAMTGDINFIM